MHENTVEVRLLDKSFHIKCRTPEEKSKLLEASHYLNAMMQTFSENSPKVTFERIAITTALNLVYEFVVTNQNSETGALAGFSFKMQEQLQKLCDRLDQALQQLNESDL